MSARCVTDWPWPQVRVAHSRRLLLHKRRRSRWCPTATFRTYAEILRPDHPMMKIRKATTTWRPSRSRPAEIEQAMRAEPGLVLGDALQRTGGADKTTTRLTPKFREDIREIAELTSDDELLRIAEFPEVPVSLEHLRQVDPQTRIVVGYQLDVTPAESPRLRRRLALPPDPGSRCTLTRLSFQAVQTGSGALCASMPTAMAGPVPRQIVPLSEIAGRSSGGGGQEPRSGGPAVRVASASSEPELAGHFELPALPSVVSRTADDEQYHGARHWPENQQGSQHPIENVIDDCLAGITWVEIDTNGLRRPGARDVK